MIARVIVFDLPRQPPSPFSRAFERGGDVLGCGPKGSMAFPGIDALRCEAARVLGLCRGQRARSESTCAPRARARITVSGRMIRLAVLRTRRDRNPIRQALGRRYAGRLGGSVRAIRYVNLQAYEEREAHLSVCRRIQVPLGHRAQF
jgi:hypothetical protein